MEIEQPKFDELAPALSDVDEVGDALIEEAHHRGIAELASSVSTYWLTLHVNEIPSADCTKLTREWMNICAWGEEA